MYLYHNLPNPESVHDVHKTLLIQVLVWGRGSLLINKNSVLWVLSPYTDRIFAFGKRWQKLDVTREEKYHYHGNGKIKCSHGYGKTVWCLLYTINPKNKQGLKNECYLIRQDNIQIFYKFNFSKYNINRTNHNYRNK